MGGSGGILKGELIYSFLFYFIFLQSLLECAPQAHLQCCKKLPNQYYAFPDTTATDVQKRQLKTDFREKHQDKSVVKRSLTVDKFSEIAMEVKQRQRLPLPF